MSQLMTSLGLDWEDVPHCYRWEDFVGALKDFTDEKIDTSLYAKIVMSESGYPDTGEGHFFSTTDDMEYSEADIRYMQGVETDMPY